MAKVDILLPYWGKFDLLKRSVESVLNQTFEDWQLLVFDDCYPSDEAPSYFKKIKDSRITYFRHKKNLGITKNFNYALQHAEADYCIMFGCDDVMLPNYLETALAEIGNASFYQPAIEIIDENGKVYRPLADKIKSAIALKPGVHNGEKLAVSLCRGNWLYFPSIVWKTDIIKKYGFDEKYKIAEDLLLEFQLIVDGNQLRVGAETLFQYRRFAQSLSSVEKKRGGVRFGEEDEVYELFAKRFRNIGWRKAACAANIRMTSRLHKMISR